MGEVFLIESGSSIKKKLKSLEKIKSARAKKLKSGP